jgi:hypothetical protein
MDTLSFENELRGAALYAAVFKLKQGFIKII